MECTCNYQPISIMLDIYVVIMFKISVLIKRIINPKEGLQVSQYGVFCTEFIFSKITNIKSCNMSDKILF
jgi:hypothetical protein